MAEKKFTVRMVAEGGQQVRQEFDTVSGRARTAYQEIAQGAKSAERSAAVFEAQLREQSDAFRQLRASLDPAYAAQRRYESAVEQARTALRAGIATQEEYNLVVRQAQMRLGDMDGAVIAASRSAGRGSMDFRNLSMQLSQVAQQGAATGNYLGALAIQIPDMMIGFGALGVAIGAAAAVLGTTFLPALIGSGDEADAASDSVDGLIATLDSYRAYAETAATSTAELERRFGSFGARVRETAQFIAESQVDALRDQLRDMVTDIDSAAAEIDGALLQALQVNQNIVAGNGTAEQILVMREAMAGFHEQAEEAAGSLGMTVEQVQALDAAFDALRAADTMEEIRDAADAALVTMEGMFGEGQNLPPVLRDAAQQMDAIRNNAIQAIRAAAGLSDEAARVPGPLEAGSRAAGGLSSSLAQATGTARALVATLGQVPAALQAMASQADAAVATLARQNAALNYQVDRGVSSVAANILADRDTAVATAMQRTGSIDIAARVGQPFHEQAQAAERLSQANERLTATLSEMRTAATGGGGGAAGAIAEIGNAAEGTWWQIDDTKRRLIDLAEAAKQANAAAGKSVVEGLLGAAGVGAGSGPLSGLIGQAQQAMMATPAMQGLMGGIGAALGPLLPGIGWASTALQLAQGFSSSEVIDRRLVGEFGAGGYANTRTTEEVSSFWGLSKRRRTSYDFAAEETRQLREMGAEMRRALVEAGAAFGVSARDLRGVRVSFEGDLRDGAEAYAAALDRAIPGLERFRRAGEGAEEAMARLSGALDAWNASAAQLGLGQIDGTFAGGATAQRLLARAGGADAFASNVGIISQMMDPAQRLALLRGQFADRVRGLGFSGDAGALDAPDELLAALGRAQAAGNLGTYARLTQLAPLVQEIDALRVGRESAQAAEVAALDQQRVQIARMRGDERKAREIELSLMEPYLRAGQKRIWQLQKEAEAMARAEEIASERLGLQMEIWRLEGNTDAIRAQERAELDASNRRLYDRVQALRDEQEAVQAAAQAQRELQRLVETFSTREFATRAEFELARGRLAAGLDGTGGRFDVGRDLALPDVLAPPPETPQQRETRTLMREIRDLLLRSDRHEKRTADTLRKWDRIGLPAEQTT